MKAHEILNNCIDKIKNISKEEFDDNKVKLGIYDKKYNSESYIDDSIEVIIPEFDKDKIKPMFQKREYETLYAIYMKYYDTPDRNTDNSSNWNQVSKFKNDLYEVFEDYSILMKSRNGLFEYRIVKMIEVRYIYGISGVIEL